MSTLPGLVANLAAMAAEFNRAKTRYERASQARAVAAWRAREAGATWGEIAAALGVARNNLPGLVRHGARIAGGNALAPVLPPLERHVEAPEEAVTPPTPDLEPTRCPSCKRANDPGASRCVACGWRL